MNANAIRSLIDAGLVVANATLAAVLAGLISIGCSVSETAISCASANVSPKYLPIALAIAAGAGVLRMGLKYAKGIAGMFGAEVR